MFNLPSLVWLNDLGRVDAGAVVARLVISACMAGCWMGACLGGRGVIRAMLKSILVGVQEEKGLARKYFTLDV